MLTGKPFYGRFKFVHISQFRMRLHGLVPWGTMYTPFRVPPSWPLPG